MDTLSDVIAILDLDQQGPDLFSGPTYRHHEAAAQVFGGHVLAQALRAALLTTPDGRLPQSLHAYFVRPSDFTATLKYEVIRVRDGAAYSSRQVLARQHGQVVLQLIASFARSLPQSPYGPPLRSAPDPAQLASLPERLASFAGEMGGWWVRDRPVDIRYITDHPRQTVAAAQQALAQASADPTTPTGPPEDPTTTHHRVWMRGRGDAPADQGLQRCLLTYLSDMVILDSVMLLNPDTLARGSAGLASLDHSVWFHGDLDVSQWYRYEVSTPGGTERRGLGLGQVYRADGTLSATVMQEGLLRRSRRSS